MRWTQAIFLRLLQAGLAYRANAPVNWCPGCQTVLANEQVLADGTCERSGDLVVKRDLEQWFLRITAYADELLEALDSLEWPERVKTHAAQLDRALRRSRVRSAGGRSRREGRAARRSRSGCSHPSGHELRDDLTPSSPPSTRSSTSSPRPDRRAAVEELRRRVAGETDIERMASADGGKALDKRGAFTGSSVMNPFTGEPCHLCRSTCL